MTNELKGIEEVKRKGMGKGVKEEVKMKKEVKEYRS